MMKTNISNKNPFQKRKNVAKGADRPSMLYNTIKSAISSVGQSPYASYRRSCKGGSIGSKCQSVENIRKSSATYTNQVSQKKRYKENRGKFVPNPNFLSCTMTPKMYDTQPNQQSNPINRSSFKFMYQIGFGGFGKVWKVQEKSSWEYYAMKQIQKRKVIQKDSVDCIMNEKKVLSHLNHPFLVNIKWAFQDKDNLYLIMDYLKGADLRYHLCYREHFGEIQTKFILACLILAVQEIHNKGIVHRDIKPENLVLEETGYVRLTDFGIAKYIRDLSIEKYDSSGTPGYMAPEVLNREPYTQIADFFAIGVIGFELMLNKRPYVGKNRKQIKQQISLQQKYISEAELPPNWSLQSADFINKLIQRNPAERLGAKQGIRDLKEHPWMRDINWRKLNKKEIIPPFTPNIVCQTKQYLEQIQSYNEMNEEQNLKEIASLSDEQQKFFQGYDLQSSNSSNPYSTPFRNVRNTLQKNQKPEAKLKKTLKFL